MLPVVHQLICLLVVSTDLFLRCTCIHYIFFTVPPRVSAVERSPSIALWGKNFAIKFSISGDRPKVVLEDIIWKFKSSVNGKTEVINANSRLNFSDDRETLEINSVQLTDAGTYSFTASNSAGSSSASIAINVLGERLYC